MEKKNRKKKYKKKRTFFFLHHLLLLVNFSFYTVVFIINKIPLFFLASFFFFSPSCFALALPLVFLRLLSVRMQVASEVLHSLIVVSEEQDITQKSKGNAHEQNKSYSSSDQVGSLTNFGVLSNANIVYPISMMLK